MNRLQQIQQIKNKTDFDITIIGGGATGLGIAVDAATRGFKTLLLEQNDFAKGTSSRSTKLVHGGVRYLAQGDISLVIDALRERGQMQKNAPHLVNKMRFIIGNYKWWEKAFYTIGLTIYDLLAGKKSLGRSAPLSKSETIQEIPTLKINDLKGGVVYYDGQFDDARMAITLAQTAIDNGATCINHIKVNSFIKNENKEIIGLTAQDSLSKDSFNITSKVIINATGVFVDELMKLDEEHSQNKVRPSQGVHLVVDKKFIPGNAALMIPKTNDGRVLFGVPWHGKVVLGTTDTPLNTTLLEPKALESEIDFILDQAGQYLKIKPTRSDVLSIFAGLRPLAAPTQNAGEKTKEISRSHKVYISKSGLITITGGKWTTYREMAEDVLDRAIELKNLDKKKSITANLKLHGYQENVNRDSWDYVYGSDINEINKLKTENPSLNRLIHPNYTFTHAHVIWAIRNEMAVTIEDILARRVRLLFLDAKAAIQASETIAQLLAQEFNKDIIWQEQEIEKFTELASGYLLNKNDLIHNEIL